MVAVLSGGYLAYRRSSVRALTARQAGGHRASRADPPRRASQRRDPARRPRLPVEGVVCTTRTATPGAAPGSPTAAPSAGCWSGLERGSAMTVRLLEHRPRSGAVRLPARGARGRGPELQARRPRHRHRDALRRSRRPADLDRRGQRAPLPLVEVLRRGRQDRRRRAVGGDLPRAPRRDRPRRRRRASWARADAGCDGRAAAGRRYGGRGSDAHVGGRCAGAVDVDRDRAGPRGAYPRCDAQRGAREGGVAPRERRAGDPAHRRIPCDAGAIRGSPGSIARRRSWSSSTGRA
jgi:hypothetical protein